MHTKPYAIEDDKVLFVADNGMMDMIKIQKLILDQPECWEFEWNSNKSKPTPKGEAAFRADQKRIREQKRREKEEELEQAARESKLPTSKGEGKKKKKKSKKSKAAATEKTEKEEL